VSLAHSTGPESWPTHRLLSIAARLDELRINRNLTHRGLTKGSLDLLESVAELEPLTVSDLATLLCVRKQSLGRWPAAFRDLGSWAGNAAATGDIRTRVTHQGRKVLTTAEALVQRLTQNKSDIEPALHLERYIRDLRM
jgi:hypothetical protein